MHTFPRPSEKQLFVERIRDGRPCPDCGSSETDGYDVLSEGGWWHVVKCADCLASVERIRAPRLGPIVPLSTTL